MTHLKALYGGQYYSVNMKGGDHVAGRRTANITLCSFCFLFILLLYICAGVFVDDFSKDLSRFSDKLVGRSSASAILNLVVIPFMIFFYFMIAITVGSKRNYEKLGHSYMKCSEREREQAAGKVVMPFFVVLGLMLVFGLLNIFI